MSTEEVVKILAIMRAVNRDYSQTQRAGLIRDEGLDAALAIVVGNALFPHQELLDDCRRQVEDWQHHKINVVTLLDAEYPRRLLSVKEAPALVFYNGVLDADDRAVSIVGSRNATAGERAAATQIAELIATHNNMSIASGLAVGIDTAAHEGALSVGRRTVAVMGTSIDKTYPAKNRALRAQIEEQGGLVMSQFLPGTPGSKHAFPIRNVTMSGYSIATIVVAAGEHSGARHQARRALLHGRNVILLPGVVEDTQWAKDIAGRPGVYTPRSLEEVGTAIDSIVDNWKLLTPVLY